MSTERILVSHAGALPRPENLQRLFDAGPAEGRVLLVRSGQPAA